MIKKLSLFLALSFLLNSTAPLCAEPPSGNRLIRPALAILVGAGITYALWRHYDLSFATAVHPKKLIKAIRAKSKKQLHPVQKPQHNNRVPHYQPQPSFKPAPRPQPAARPQRQQPVPHRTVTPNSNRPQQPQHAQDNELWHVDPEQLITQYWGYEVIDRDRSHRVWQLKNPFVDNWACGPYTMHNAFTFERLLGLNRVSDDVSILKNYLRNNGLSLTDGVDFSHLNGIASGLKLHDFYPVDLDRNNKIKLLVKKLEWKAQKSTTYNNPKVVKCDVSKDAISLKLQTPYNWSSSQIESYAQRYYDQKLHEVINNAKQKLLSHQGNTPYILHFACMVPDHVFLISAIKLPHEQPFVLVIDNMNRRMSSNSLTYNYAHQIASMVGV